MTNPYLEEFRGLRDCESFRQEQWLGKRKELVRRYSWAIPTDEAIERLASFETITEIGAGSGYWAHLIEEAGGRIAAFDSNPPRDTWTEVIQIKPDSAASVVKSVGSECLFLCWPPRQEPMASNCLEAFEGDYVVYVGERAEGCTGDDVFHQMLLANWRTIDFYELPSYVGVHDNCYVYKHERCYRR